MSAGGVLHEKVQRADSKKPLCALFIGRGHVISFTARLTGGPLASASALEPVGGGFYWFLYAFAFLFLNRVAVAVVRHADGIRDVARK